MPGASSRSSWRSQVAPGLFFQSFEGTLGPRLESRGGLGEPCFVRRRSLGSLGDPLGDPWEALGGELAVLGVPWGFFGWSLVALPSLLGALADHENLSKTNSFSYYFDHREFPRSSMRTPGRVWRGLWSRHGMWERSFKLWLCARLTRICDQRQQLLRKE